MSPPVDVKLIDGDDAPADPNCLHCWLGSAIDAWSQAHPQKGLDEMILEVAEVLGEMHASDAVDCDVKEFWLRLNQVIVHTLRCAQEMRDTIAQKLAKDAAAAAAKEKPRAH